jgi:SAM-dependent methyltransferase
LEESGQQLKLQSSELAVAHWDKTPLNVSSAERYALYPWLPEVAEFGKHAGHHVLEIGCGAGADLEQFVLGGAKATGVDITPAHIQLAQQRLHGRATVLFADAAALPFADASFDYIYSHGVLHHIERPRRVVEEVFRVLRPAGRFNFMVYARWSFDRFKTMVRYGRQWNLHIENSRDPVHIAYYTKRELRRLFTPASLSIEKYELARMPFLQSWLGWFLVAKGQKSDEVNGRPVHIADEIAAHKEPGNPRQS